MEETLIYRDEIVQLLFSVSDIAQSLKNIEVDAREEMTMAKKGKWTQADRDRLAADGSEREAAA